MPEPARGVVRAAGAVLWRPPPAGQPGRPAGAAAGVEVALVHRPRYGDWSLPKGKRTAGEHILVTATREVAEETGTPVTLGRRLSSTAYTAADGRRKLVDYWVASPADLAAHLAARPPAAVTAGGAPEVDEVAWLGLGAARDRVSYARDLEVLDSFAAGPRETTPVVLLRHGVAVSRREWRTAGHTGDLDRPLSPGGHAQAAALAELLGCFPPARVVSSSARRCIDTVRPYAAAMGVAAEGEEAFSLEGAGRPESVSGHPRSTAAVARLRALVSAGRPVVICAHRQNLPGLLAAACDQLGAAVPPGPPLSKGAFWVLHVAAGQLAGAEQHQVGGEEREASLARP